MRPIIGHNMPTTTRMMTRIDQATGYADASPDIQLVPSTIAVLTGKNNVGKTRTLQLIATAFNSGISIPTLECSFSVRLEREDNVIIDIKVVGGYNGRGAYTQASGSLAYSVLDNGQSAIDSLITFGPQGGISIKDKKAGTQSQYQAPPDLAHIRGLRELPYVLDAFRSVIYIPPHRVIPSVVDTTPKQIPSPDGSDLGQVLYYHRNNQTNEFAELEDIIPRIFPEIGSILTVPTGPQHVTIMLIDRYSGERIPLSDAGTGVSQILFFIALVLFSPCGRTFLVDEPHVFLHPAAERQLSSFIREHSEHSYIIATHSPLLINTLDPVWLWLVSRDERGTLIRPIYQSIQGRQLLFSELGIKSGEVAIADRILFVEDDSDCDIYKILLGKLGYDENRYNYHAIGLTGAGVTKPFRQIVSALNTVFNIKHLFFLDGDQRGNFLQDPCIRFLPEPEIEDLLLRDMDAVCSIFKDAIMAQAPDNGNDTIADWTPE